MSKVYIGLGSNKGDRINYLNLAISELDQNERISIVDISSFYETRPYGVMDQPNYINGVILVETDFTPQELYKSVKKIEGIVGRTISRHWGPREIDLDIILYDSIVYADEMIEIPHKEYSKRDFVLVPLLEISPDLADPVSKEKAKGLLNKLEETFIIQKLGNNIKEKLGAEIV
ncbi:MAG: 2-amino-4-hydroxy-6-hydroxymethyldihydropteridine diphosphokinase [Bacteroidota bacterium]